MSLDEKLEGLSKAMTQFEALQIHTFTISNTLTKKFKNDDELTDSEFQTRATLKACFQAGAVSGICEHLGISNEKQARIYFFESNYKSPEVIENIVAGILGVSKIDGLKDKELLIARELANKAYEMARTAILNILKDTKTSEDEWAWFNFLEFQEEIREKNKKKWQFF